MTIVRPRTRPLQLKLPPLPKPAAEREEMLRAIAAALVTSLTPATARALAAAIDEVADEQRSGTWAS